MIRTAKGRGSAHLRAGELGFLTIASLRGGDDRRTFFPTSPSLKKNPAPRSSSEISPPSTSISLPIPASTIFFIVSVAVPRSCTTQMVALRILVMMPLSAVSNMQSAAEPQVTFAELRAPITESVCRRARPHLSMTRFKIQFRRSVGPSTGKSRMVRINVRKGIRTLGDVHWSVLAFLVHREQDV